MKKRPMTPADYEKIYSFYDTNRQNRVLGPIGHMAMWEVLRPKIHMSGKVQEQIATLLKSETRLAMIVNHTRVYDPIIVAGTAWKSPALRQLVGHTIIPSKDSLFQNPLSKFCVNAMGGIPAFRDTDHTKNSDQSKAGLRLVDTVSMRLDAGFHLALFPEGYLNADPNTTLLPLKSGLGRMIMGTENATKVALLPIGIAYSPTNPLPFSPNVVIGDPITQGLTSKNRITQLATMGLQAVVMQARQYSYS